MPWCDSVVEVRSYVQWPDKQLFWMNLEVMIIVFAEGHPADFGPGYGRCNSASWLRRRNEFVHWVTKGEILANDEHIWVKTVSEVQQGGFCYYQMSFCG